MTISWVTAAGDLGTITERVTLEIPLEATTTTSNPVNYSLISGSLPRGLRLDGNIIKGSPTEVRTLTKSRFVIRAGDGEDIEDRTFSLTVDGSDAPEWLTREGFLPVGENNTFFVLDNAFVNFQLEVYDPDLVAGDTLTFYIPPGGGELPPGLNLSSDGYIKGFTDPIFSVEYTTGTGGYDSTAFDVIALDSGPNREIGYDTNIYDFETYDYTEETAPPKRLSRYYSFVVVVSDGEHEVRRSFRIYVVTEEFLRADNTIIQVDTGIFKADNTPERSPIWITESNLGRRRANNFITIYLDVYNPPTLQGTIAYFLKDLNSDGSTSELPPGTVLDSVTGEVAGRVPYQPRISKTYTFTVEAINFPDSLQQLEYNSRGVWNNNTEYKINDAVNFDGFLWIAIADNQAQSPQDISQYWSKGIASTDKTFTIELIGEVESGIEWITDSDRGTIKPNQASHVYVEARSLLYGGRVVYELVGGSLPPGMELLSNGTVIGKAQKYSINGALGLTRFYNTGSDGLKRFDTTFDGGSSTFDRIFKFSVKAKDGVNFSESIKEFTVRVDADTDVNYSNLYLKAFQPKNKRLAWFDFITDANIFRPDELYRYGDVNFGIQPELKVLLFAGIESKDAVNFVQAMSRNHYRKRLRFGNLRKVEGKNPETQQVEYETVIVDIDDELEKNKKSIAETVTLKNGITSRVLVSTDRIRVSNDVYLASERDNQRVFPNSFKNMRNRVKAIGERDRSFLPLWMRSIQDDSFVESGYVGAVILCYVKPGMADLIMARIRASEFDFKQLDFEADRYVADSIAGEIQDQYLLFPQRDIINKLPNPSPIPEEIIIVFSSFDSDSVSFDSDSLTFDNGRQTRGKSNIPIQPNYYLTRTQSIVSEGDTVDIVLLTTNVPDNTTFSFTIQGNVTAQDLGLNSLIGFVNVVNGEGRLSITINEDRQTEGDEIFTVILDDLDPIISTSILIKDTSQAPVLVETFDLQSSAPSVDEGSSVTFTLTTQNIADGTLVPYTITGIDSLDINGDSLTGNFTINNNVGTVVLNITSDNITEGGELITFSLDNGEGQRTVVINDTSQGSNPGDSNANPTYLLSSSVASANEGDIFTISLITTNIADGTQIPYSILGISASDIDVGLTGNFTVNNNLAQLTITVLEDLTTEGLETLTLSLDNGEATVSLPIGDTSLTPFNPQTTSVSNTTGNYPSTTTITITGS